MNGIEVVDVTDRAGAPPVRDLLAYAVYPPDPEKLDRVARMYQETDARLIGFEQDGAMTGLLGFERMRPDHVVIRHIAVAPGARLRGIGRFMVTWLSAWDGIRHVTAETDREAVGFYWRCGFVTTNLGELYPGTERFRCDLGVSPVFHCQSE